MPACRAMTSCLLIGLTNGKLPCPQHPSTVHPHTPRPSSGWPVRLALFKLKQCPTAHFFKVKVKKILLKEGRVNKKYTSVQFVWFCLFFVQILPAGKLEVGRWAGRHISGALWRTAPCYTNTNTSRPCVTVKQAVNHQMHTQAFNNHKPPTSSQICIIGMLFFHFSFISHNTALVYSFVLHKSDAFWVHRSWPPVGTTILSPLHPPSAANYMIYSNPYLVG